jgi:AraC-like DNA-binding protein
VRLDGTLEELTAKADVTLREAKTTARAEGSVVVRPFADAILGSANVKLQGVDLSTIAPSLPHTRLDADVDLATLAQGLGYFDQAHFTSDFRRLVGKSPGRYREEARRTAGE